MSSTVIQVSTEASQVSSSLRNSRSPVQSQEKGHTACGWADAATAEHTTGAPRCKPLVAGGREGGGSARAQGRVQELSLACAGPAMRSALVTLMRALRAAAAVAVGRELVVARAAAAVGSVDAVGLHRGRRTRRPVVTLTAEG